MTEYISKSTVVELQLTKRGASKMYYMNLHVLYMNLHVFTFNIYAYETFPRGAGNRVYRKYSWSTHHTKLIN